MSYILQRYGQAVGAGVRRLFRYTPGLLCRNSSKALVTVMEELQMTHLAIKNGVAVVMPS